VKAGTKWSPTDDGTGHNMYGCTPCPKCGSKYRAVFKKNRKRDEAPEDLGFISCDDCGYEELGRRGPERFEWVAARAGDKEETR